MAPIGSHVMPSLLYPIEREKSLAFDPNDSKSKGGLDYIHN